MMPQEVRNINGRLIQRNADGTFVDVTPQQSQMPADPTFPYQGQKAQADTRSAQANARVNEATVNSQISLANAQAAKAQAEANAAIASQGNGGGLTDAQKQVDGEFAKMYAEMQASGGIADIRKQVGQLKDAMKVLESSDTITGPIIGRLPDFIQQSINPDAINVREQVEEVVQRNLRLVLGAQFTAQEGERLISRAYNPALQEGDNSKRVQSLIDQMDSALDSRESAMKYYEQKGTIAGWTPGPALGNQNNGDVPGAPPDRNPLDVSDYRNQPDPDRQVAAEGSLNPFKESTRTVRNSRLSAKVDAMINAGASKADIDAVLTQNGYAASPMADYMAVKKWMANHPGKRYSGTNVHKVEDLSIGERIAGSEAGSFLAHMSDAATAGGVSAISGDEGRAALDAMSEMNPASSMLGAIGGSIGGTAAIGKLGAKAASKVAPNLLGGGGKAQFGRNLATDVAYSGAYGANTGQGALPTAALGGAGSVVGQGAGKVLGGVVGGAAQSAPVQALKDQGVRLTTGQRFGGAMKAIEDKMTSTPFVGDMVKNRRMEGFQDFNQAAMREAGAPIGFNPANIGKDGVSELGEAVGRSYDDATAGVNAPFDAQFADDFQGAVQRGSMLPKDRRRDLGQVLEARVQPLTDAGGMSGEQFQQAMRALKQTRNRPPSRFEGFEQDYRDSVSGAMDALTGQMERAGGENVVQGLNRANAANRNFKTIEDASNRAAGGSQTGENFVFTPSQLQRAGMMANKKFPGARPFEGLADAGQEVLPSSIPNTGTADRIAQMALPGVGAVGLGTGAGYAAGGTDGAQSGAMTSAAIMALLAGGGTRGGQNALNKIVFDRPDAVRKAGELIRKRKGLFGSAAVPLTISANQ